MFRTARAFLVVAPVAFAVAVLGFLVSHPRAAEDYSVLPFLQDAVGPSVAKRPFLRFVVSSAAFFVPPYLVGGLLLLFADLGVAAAGRLWSNRRGEDGASIAPETRWAFAGGSVAAALAGGVLLHRVAHGGDLPGGVNVSPMLVAAVPFAAVVAGLVAALLAALPRALARKLGAEPRDPRREI